MASVQNIETDFDISLDEAEAHQEIATKQATNDMLFENERMLNDLLKEQGSGNLSPRYLNLAGLLYRRLGERESLGDERFTYLDKALETFATIQKMEREQISIETRNNWAIALIRYFELTKNTDYLDKAEEVLQGIDYSSKELSSSELLALPRSLNNRGNIYKQRLIHSRDSQYYQKAIDAYDKTKSFWTKETAPLDWATIQKNKAEARCVYMEITGFNEDIAETALDEINASLKIRNEVSAPYQYQKSINIKERLEAMIGEA